MSTTLPKIRCSAQRADGNPCQAWATHTGRCAGHEGLGIAANPKAYGAMGAAASLDTRQTHAENRKKTPQDWLATKLEARAQEIVQAAVDKAEDGDISAIRWLWEASFGKPQERVAVQSEGDVRAMSPEARAELRRRALAAHPDLLELVPKDEGKPVVATETSTGTPG